MQRYQITSCLIYRKHSTKHIILQKKLSYLRKQGVQRYANTYFERQAGQPIVMFGPNILIGRTLYGLTPSTDDINTYK